MNLSWEKNDKGSEAVDATRADTANAGNVATDATAFSGVKDTASGSQQPGKKHGGAFTPKKGYPTPKRNEVERERGIRRDPVEAPLAARETRQRHKEFKASMPKEELKAAETRERTERREQHRVAGEHMTAGDPRYVLPRDQDAERKFIRDWVDSRRFLVNAFPPFVSTLSLIIMISTSLSKLTNTASLTTTVLIIALVIEGTYIDRRVIKLTRERLPKTAEGAWGLDFYAYSRASQPCRLRTSRPQVNIGDETK